MTSGSLKSYNHILVTGSPRSGTTWVGRLLDSIPLTRYVHEPFNISGQNCSCGTRFDYWFYYLTAEKQGDYQEHLRHTINPASSRIGLYNAISETRRIKKLRPIKSYLQALYSRQFILKDPIALFSAERLARMFDMDVIILIRHPAAVVSSYKMLKWGHPFSHFLHQPALIEEQLAPFRSEIEEFARKDKDIVDQAALLWKLIHYAIHHYQEVHPAWNFVRYMDLALDPISSYKALFEKLNLPFSGRAYRYLQANSLPEHQKESGDSYSIRQNARRAVSKWKQNLTQEEIDRVRRRVEEVSSFFYRDAEWK